RVGQDRERIVEATPQRRPSGLLYRAHLSYLAGHRPPPLGETLRLVSSPVKSQAAEDGGAGKEGRYRQCSEMNGTRAFLEVQYTLHEGRCRMAGLGNALRRLRRERGLEQQELARRAGITRQTLSRLESGRAAPSAAIALRLARELGCRVEELFWLAERARVI